MESKGTLLLSRNQVAGLLRMDECIAEIEKVFRAFGEGKAPPPGILGVHAEGGGFHIKAGLMEKRMRYFAAKINANFPENMSRFNLPTIQGILYLADAANGYPLALMDSIELTIRRTGAATAVAAKYLARKSSRVLTLAGCGNQGRIHLESLLSVLPLERAYLHDVDERKSRALADLFSGRLSVEVVKREQLALSLKGSDICVTCTPAKHVIVNSGDVPTGMFIAAVGADNEEKQELDPALFRAAKVVTDLTSQCSVIGDLHHALACGVLGLSDVYGELGEIVAGKKAGRKSEDEIIIFDSTGIALQDVAAASLVYEQALAAGTGSYLRFNQP